MEEQFTVKKIIGHQSMHRASYESYQRDLKARLSLGRYTLEEAALFVCEQTGEHAKAILNQLIGAAKSGTLKIYSPYSRIPRTREEAQQVWFATEEAYWNGLNEWLKINLPLLDCEFPDPDASAAKVGAVTSQSGDDVEDDDDDDENWIIKCPAIAQKLGEKQLETTGAQQINASSMCEAVAEELGLDPTTHGRQGPRSAHNVRTEGLKGWKFRPPKIVKK